MSDLSLPLISRNSVLTLLLLGLFLAIFADPAQADRERYKALSFSHIDVEGIDSLSAIVAIEQDSHGFLWFGGKNGIVRYDGYQAQAFRYQPGKTAGLSSNDISDLHLDRKGQLWIAHLSGGGLSRYDSASRSFIHYRNKRGDPNSLSNDSIYAIAEDADGNLWLGTHGGGLNKFDQASGKFTHYKFDPQDLDSISDNVIRDLAIDNSGFIWLATATGGLNKFDPVTAKSKLYLHDKNNSESLSENELNKIFIDDKQNVWVGGYANGINFLPSGNDKFVRFIHDPRDESSIGGGMVWDITQDFEGKIWIATGNGDLNRFDETSKRFHRSRHAPHNPQSISGAPTSIFIDNAGDVWVGSYFSSVDYLNLSATKFSSLDLRKIEDARLWPRNITALTTDRDDNLWLASDRGLAFYDLQNAELHYISDDSQIDGEIPNYPIRSLMADASNNIWIGTIGGGLIFYNRYDKKIVDIGRQTNLKGNKVWAIHQDKQGDIWVGTQTRGLAKYNKTEKKFEHLISDENDPSKLGNAFVWDIYSDRKNTLWVATQKGLARIENNTGAFKRFMNVKQNPTSLSSNSVRAIAESENGDMWFATDSGLNKYNPESMDFSVYRVSNGLVDDNISSLTHDKNGRLWFATQKGLSRFSKNEERFEHFDYRNGIVGRSFPRRAIAKDSKGNVFVGNAKGITVIDPDVEEHNNFIPPVLITAIKLANEELGVGEDSPLKKEVFYSRSIELEKNHSLITIEFAALSYYISSKNRYAYKLEGFDKDWLTVDSDQRRAVYTNLDPGKYTFFVKGSNNDGLWNDIPAQLTIVIPPPWYMTWWSRFIASVLAIVAIYSFFSWRLRRNKFRQLLLQKKVNEKTRELATANDAIKELNQELEERVARRTNELSVEIEERRQAEEKLFHMAFHDALTGLPNRYWLVQELKARIEKLKSHAGFRFALLFLDGDRFKQINDTHGHLLGDKLLVSAAIRLKTILEDKHHVVRLGGDEFTILIDDVDSIEDVKATAQNIINAFERPFYPEQNKIFFKVSIGMVLCEELYSKPEQILRDADIALYRAKDKGKGVFQIFDSKMREETIEASVLESDLHSALNNEELFLKFQPIVNLEDGSLTGFEALLRWNHPEKGLIKPDKFIPIAEEAGLITTVGLIALEKALPAISAVARKPQIRKTSDHVCQFIFFTIKSARFIGSELTRCLRHTK